MDKQEAERLIQVLREILGALRAIELQLSGIKSKMK